MLGLFIAIVVFALVVVMWFYRRKQPFEPLSGHDFFLKKQREQLILFLSNATIPFLKC